MDASATGAYEASDGYVIRYRHWRPEGLPLGYVVALHGIQSHSGWYGYSSQRLASAGYDVRFLDRRGSGINEARRGHAAHQDRLINDVVQALELTRRERRTPSAPVVLLGVSWGGKLAAATAARRPNLVDGLALLYPGICARFRPRIHQRLLLRLAVAAGKELREAPIPLDDPTLFTGQSEWQQFIAADPLALHRATVAFFQASVQLDRLAHEATRWLTCPVLLMLAGRDRIIDNRATRAWFDRVGSPRRTLIEYPEAAHTLEFEPDRERVFGDLIHWLRSLPPR